MRFWYTCSVLIYAGIVRIAALFSSKAKLWVRGRHDWTSKLRDDLNGQKGMTWVHCASLGEFEQGRPLIESLHERGERILLTFFSPSGYEAQKDFPLATAVAYIPVDTISNAKKFLEIAAPKTAIFVKYEFWFNFLHVLFDREIPTFLISGIFRSNQHFFKAHGAWFRSHLKRFSMLFVQDESSMALLRHYGIQQVSISGDTRFDRVAKIAEAPQSFPLIEKFIGDEQVLLVGSSWPEDESLIAQLLEKKESIGKCIIAPHEIGERHINQLVATLQSSWIRYSQADDENIQSANILIIDSIGMLSHLYQYGRWAYIGGGFGKGIHNILEAATFGLPCIFGPNYNKFKEARDLIESGGAFNISSFQELQSVMERLTRETDYQSAQQSARSYVKAQQGATQRILDAIH